MLVVALFVQLDEIAVDIYMDLFKPQIVFPKTV